MSLCLLEFNFPVLFVDLGQSAFLSNYAKLSLFLNGYTHIACNSYLEYTL
jgi:hypothetical protein